MKINKKITFFYQSGRLDKINNNTEYAKEMFYGYHYFEEKYQHVDIVEFTRIRTKIRKLFRKYIEKKISTVFKLPIYWSYLVTSKNNNVLKESDYVIFNNNRVGASIVPLLIWNKLIRKKIAISLCFVLGLFSRTTKYKFLMPFHNFYIWIMLVSIDKLIFLSEGEMNFARNKFKNFSHKFFLLPFAIDRDIWKHSEIPKQGVLFVGNDGFRNFEMVHDIINSLPNVEFTVVSEFINENSLIHNNFKIYKGSWGHPAISDIELSKLYARSLVTIIPLKNSLQPSGQSVALQSLSCGTPVIISLTDGFWDLKNFQDKKNIHFVSDESVQAWESIICKILNKKNPSYKKLSESGLKTIVEEYDLIKFSKKIESILFS